MEVELYAIGTWNRATNADGALLNANTISPLTRNDEIVASAVNDYISSANSYVGGELLPLAESLSSATDYYNEGFGAISNSAHYWNSTVGTVSAHAVSCWNPVHEILGEQHRADEWNGMVSNISSGVAASAWLAQNGMLEMEFSEPTETIMYAGDGERNRTAEHSMLLHYKNPVAQNAKTSAVADIVSRNRCFTIVGDHDGKMGYPTHENKNSNITIDGCALRQVQNSLAKKWSSKINDIYNSVDFGGHMGLEEDNENMLVANSIIASYQGTDKVEESISVGPNIRHIRNTVTTSVGQESIGNVDSILSFKGGGVVDSIAIKGSLWQDFDVPVAHHSYDDLGKLGNIPVYSYSDKNHYARCYFRNIKGIDGTNDGRDATFYNFNDVTDGIAMNASGGRFDWNDVALNSALNSITVLDNFDPGNFVTFENSIASLEGFRLVSGVYANDILLGNNLNVRADTKNSLLLGRRADNVEYNIDSYADTVLDTGGQKRAYNSGCITLTNFADEMLSDSIAVASGYTTYDNLDSRNLVVGHDFRLNGTTDSSLTMFSRVHMNAGSDSCLLNLSNFLYNEQSSRLNESLVCVNSGSIDESCGSNLILGNNVVFFPSYNSVTINGNVSSTSASRDNWTTSIINARMDSYYTIYHSIINSTDNSAHPFTNHGYMYQCLYNCAGTEDRVEIDYEAYRNLVNVDSIHITAPLYNMLFNGVGIELLEDSITHNMFVNAGNETSGANEFGRFDRTLTKKNNLINGSNNKQEELVNTIICGDGNKNLSENRFWYGGSVIVGNDNSIDYEAGHRINGTSMLIVGNGFRNSTEDSVKMGGGIHIGPDLDYVADVKLNSLLDKLEIGLGDLFYSIQGPTKPMIISKDDGAYFVCFKGQVSKLTAQPTTHMFFRKQDDDEWYDVFTKTAI